MKNINALGIQRKLPLAMLISAVSVGSLPLANAATMAEAVAGGKAGLDLRYRYETVDIAGSANKAKASTLKTSLSYETGAYEDFGAFLQMDDVTAFGGKKYNSTVNGKTAYPVVADPQGTEVNQAYLAYMGLTDTTLKYGRQMVVLDNARFIGNVGWRQNMQTFDAFTAVNKSLADTAITYGYVTNVNRIFGERSSKGDIKTKTHLVNVSYSGLSAGKLTGYAYLLDLKSAASHQDLGVRFIGAAKVSEAAKLLYSAEFAKQSDYKDGAATIDADYNLLEVGVSMAGVTAKLGYEVLGGDGSYAFQTPLATGHAFNGWTDQFLSTPVNGLQDTYLSVAGKLAGVKLVAVYHDFSADSGGGNYGTETDLLAVKKLSDNYTVLAKYGSFAADNVAYKDTDKLWLMAEASF